MKKRAIIYVTCTICAITIIRLWPGFYTHITHMNNKDLEWGKNRCVGETFYFRDEFGRLDSAAIIAVDIRNSLNPINHGAPWSSYHAYISINYMLFHDQGEQLDGNIIMKKEKNFEPVYFLGGIGNLFCGGYYSPVQLSEEKMQIGEYELSDCVIFDANNGNIRNRPDILRNNPICGFVWSKQYGLMQYSFRSGTVFNRIDLK